MERGGEPELVRWLWYILFVILGLCILAICPGKGRGIRLGEWRSQYTVDLGR